VHAADYLLKRFYCLVLCSDVTKLPGYQQIPPNCPLWKKAMIEKKNRQLEEDAVVCLTETCSIQSWKIILMA